MKVDKKSPPVWTEAWHSGVLYSTGHITTGGGGGLQGGGGGWRRRVEVVGGGGEVL